MRLKHFYCKTMREALEQVRQELGAEAIIVSTEEGDKGVRVVAATEGATAPKTPKRGPNLEAIFRRHHVSPDVAQSVLARVSGDGSTNPESSLANVLDSINIFRPLDLSPKQPIILLGPPGVGKSVAIAKLASQCVLNDQPVHLITADKQKAGAVSQLTTYAEALDVGISVIEKPMLLKRAVEAKQDDQVLLIDTPGINPYDHDDLEMLASVINQIEALPILAISAEYDAHYAMDVAGLFDTLNINQMIITKIDITPRLGNVLTLACESTFQITAFGSGASLADLLKPATPQELAKFLINDDYRSKSHDRFTRA
ncbi:MAG: hypothetical protein ACPGXY_03065 [Alphaproteobacteria bacterium]